MKIDSELHPDGRLVLHLPLPSREVSPNARRGQSRAAAIAKSRVVKAHRRLAAVLTRSAMAKHSVIDPAFGGYSLAFFFETAAFRDDDNADGSFKSYRDGIADALRMNDRDLKKVLLSVHAKDAGNPRVEVTLYPRLSSTKS